MIHTSGVYVFENKNYDGLIIGNPDEEYWTEIFNPTDPKTFYKREFSAPACRTSCTSVTSKETFPEPSPFTL